jgi:Tfp pilus assembly protein PilO
MSAANRLIVSILLVAALAIGFWVMLLGPKREEATKLSAREGQLRVTLSEAQAKAAAAEEAKRKFPGDYRQLVVLGQAVPAGDETASLLVELNEVADSSQVKFTSLLLAGSGESGGAAPLPATEAAPPAEAPAGAVPASATVPPTEVAASVLPLGATIGPAGLGVMPYKLTFSGNFFEVAEFIKQIDSLVDAGEDELTVDGRLVTLDGFALNADMERGFPHLNATFAVTTYVTPPGQGAAAGATPTEPAPVAASTTSSSTETPTSSTEATPGSDAQ